MLVTLSAIGVFLVGIAYVSIGIGMAYFRYKIISHGTLCNAKVMRFEKLSGFGEGYEIYVCFTFNDKHMDEHFIMGQSAIFRSSLNGKEYAVYYSEKHPMAVARKGVGGANLCINKILLGVFLIFLTSLYFLGIF